MQARVVCDKVAWAVEFTIVQVAIGDLRCGSEQELV